MDGDGEEKKKNESMVQRYMTGEVSSSAVNETICMHNVEYSKPNSYTGNRKLYDSPSAKINAKKKVFANNQYVKDPYTEKELCLRKQEAKAKFGNQWQEHLAETDHTVPIERIHNKYKDNPFITNEDIKEVANSKKNIQVTSRKVNNAKRSRTNDELISDEQYCKDKNIPLTSKGKDQAIKAGSDAQKYIDSEMRYRMVKNGVKTFHEGGMNTAESAARFTAVFSAANNLLDVIKGKKSGTEAVKDFASDTGKSFAIGYITGGSLSVVARAMSSSESQFVKALLKNNVPGRVVSAVMQTGDILYDFAKGKITFSECCQNLGERGVGITIAGYGATMGQALIPIPFVGAMIGSMVASAVYGGMYSHLKASFDEAEMAKQEYERIKVIEDKAIRRLHEEQVAFEAMTQKLFAERAISIDAGLAMVRTAEESHDANTMMSGMNEILSSFGRELPYHSTEELRSFIDDDDFTLEL